MIQSGDDKPEPSDPQSTGAPELVPIGGSYTIEALADLTRVPRRLIVLYQRHGLVVPASKSPDGDWYFDDQTIQVVRRIEYFRRTCGVNLAGVKLIMNLMDQVEHLRAEVRFFHRQ
jgi:chaperone modulatory protein CbpM